MSHGVTQINVVINFSVYVFEFHDVCSLEREICEDYFLSVQVHIHNLCQPLQSFISIIGERKVFSFPVVLDFQDTQLQPFGLLKVLVDILFTLCAEHVNKEEVRA